MLWPLSARTTDLCHVLARSGFGRSDERRAMLSSCTHQCPAVCRSSPASTVQQNHHGSSRRSMYLPERSEARRRTRAAVLRLMTWKHSTVDVSSCTPDVDCAPPTATAVILLLLVGTRTSHVLHADADAKADAEPSSMHQLEPPVLTNLTLICVAYRRPRESRPLRKLNRSPTS